MAYCVDTSPAVGASDVVHTTQRNPLGAVRLFSDGNYYIYLKGATSVAANDWVTYIEGTWTAIRLVAGAKGSVALAQAAVDTATEYGWFGVVGSFTGACESSMLSNAYCYAAGTAEVDDTIVKNDQIKGARTATAASANTCTVAVNRPYIGSNDESA